MVAAAGQRCSPARRAAAPLHLHCRPPPLRTGGRPGSSRRRERQRHPAAAAAAVLCRPALIKGAGLVPLRADDKPAERGDYRRRARAGAVRALHDVMAGGRPRRRFRPATAISGCLRRRRGKVAQITAARRRGAPRGPLFAAGRRAPLAVPSRRLGRPPTPENGRRLPPRRAGSSPAATAVRKRALPRALMRVDGSTSRRLQRCGSRRLQGRLHQQLIAET